MKKLKLFVWTDVLCDYTCGIAFALANNIENAKILIKENCSYIPEGELDGEPVVYNSPIGFAVWGGG